MGIFGRASNVAAQRQQGSPALACPAFREGSAMQFSSLCALATAVWRAPTSGGRSRDRRWPGHDHPRRAGPNEFNPTTETADPPYDHTSGGSHHEDGTGNGPRATNHGTTPSAAAGAAAGTGRQRFPGGALEHTMQLPSEIGEAAAPIVIGAHGQHCRPPDVWGPQGLRRALVLRCGMDVPAGLL